MNREAILEQMGIERQYIEVGEKQIARQREVIAQLERGGHDTYEERVLLEPFEEFQADRISHRDRLEKALKEASD